MHARLEVVQRYCYTYSAPVTDVRQRLLMVPPARHHDQRLVAYTLEVGGATPGWELAWETDAFGNRVARVLAPRVEQTLTFEARYVVERTPYLRPTALTAPDDHLHAVADQIRRQASSAPERAEQAHDWTARAIMYQVGATDVRTPAAMALHLGRGVCQDYAHLLLCVLRLLRIPARYVSGQLLGEGVPHAWVEALVDGEVMAYDPTHHRRIRLDYVTVAVGRDYADVAPTSGTFTGAATGVLSAAKHASALLVRQAPGDPREGDGTAA
jgi:transglutaminase-like putative cysteine protease